MKFFSGIALCYVVGFILAGSISQLKQTLAAGMSPENTRLRAQVQLAVYRAYGPP